jgi:hypothetical protein
MARIAVHEESDDDFPDLAELCRRPNLGTVKGGGAQDLVWKKDTEDPGSKSTRDSKTTRIEKEIVGMKKGTAKKRVLNQISDNSLLRPISRASSELMGEVQKKGKEVRADFKEIRTKATLKTGPDSDQEEREEPAAAPKKTAASRSKESRKVASKCQPTSTSIFKSDEEDFEEESDGLSDFIVNDSTFLEEEDSVIEMPPPRSVRRLVKGRRPAKDEDDDEDLDMRMKKLAVDDEPVKKSRKVSVEKHLEDFQDSFSDGQTIPRTKLPNRTQPKASQPQKEPVPKQKTPTIAPSSDIDDPFTLRLLVLSLQIDYLKLTESFSQFTIREQAKKSLQRNTICNTPQKSRAKTTRLGISQETTTNTPHPSQTKHGPILATRHHQRMERRVLSPQDPKAPTLIIRRHSLPQKVTHQTRSTHQRRQKGLFRTQTRSSFILPRRIR